MKFITYFDFLGFGDFIRNNDLEVQQKVMNNIFRDIEFTLSKGESREGRYGLIAELSKLKLNCINFSDTIIIWSKGLRPCLHSFSFFVCKPIQSSTTFRACIHRASRFLRIRQCG